MGAEVTLVWDAPTPDANNPEETTAAYYEVYRGSQSGVYGTTPLYSGPEATCVLDVPAGYSYFVAFAFNAADKKSEPSNEAVREPESPGAPVNLRIEIGIQAQKEPDGTWRIYTVPPDSGK